MGKYIDLDNIPKKTYELTLGEDYTIASHHRFFWLKIKEKIIRVRFIKTTRKGFNFLHLDTSKCILKYHMYCSDYSHVEIPAEIKTFKVKVPNWIYVDNTKYELYEPKWKKRA